MACLGFWKHLQVKFSFMLLVISGRLKVLKKLSNSAKKKKKKTGFMQLNISTDLKASEE